MEDDDELTIKEIISIIRFSKNKTTRKESVDTVASYGKIAIPYLLDLKSHITDPDLQEFIKKKINKINARERK